MREADSYISYVIDPQSRLEDQNYHACPQTSYTRLVRECMDREPYLR
jgi:hypothetical protein